ncbi:MAG: DUF4386 domain-containing protein [Caldilineaceae bacterium]
MTTQRKNAVTVGLLFIIATVFLFIGQAVYKPILSAPDYLEITYPNRMTVIVGILLEFIIVLAMPLIPVFAFPVLKRHNEALAIGYIVFRALESVVIIAVAEINKLSLIGVSETYLKGWRGRRAILRLSARPFRPPPAGEADTGGLLYVLLFAVGGFMLCHILYSQGSFRAGWQLGGRCDCHDLHQRCSAPLWNSRWPWS